MAAPEREGKAQHSSIKLNSKLKFYTQSLLGDEWTSRKMGTRTVTPESLLVTQKAQAYLEACVAAEEQCGVVGPGCPTLLEAL